jgi:hypothetical protein
LKVLNIHKREIQQPKKIISQLISTLSSKEDNVWPTEKWPAMRFKDGLEEGSKGGHGPIRYFVKKYIVGESIEFVFLKPSGFNGTHTFKIFEINKNTTLVKHTIKMDVSGKGMVLWLFAIRSLHDALIEDAFDKIENQFSKEKKKTNWSFWVRFLRKILK